jgi:quinoprotein glucose dehydrogenase
VFELHAAEGLVKRLCAVMVIASAASLASQQRSRMVEWPHWGGDAAQTKYSTAADITPANVRDLELAWTWQTIDRPMPEFDLRPGGFQNTPLMIDGVLYVSTSYHRIVALDPDTGAQLWVFDPKTYEEGPPLIWTGLNSRGLAHWRGPDGQTRLLIAGRQRLFSVDGKTGKADVAFGLGGAAALNVDLGRDVPRLRSQVTSPPVVFKNLVIVGSGVPDRLQYRSDPPGAVQAFDIRTGKRAWVFFPIPQSASDPAIATWGDGSWKIAGHANIWAPMTLDEARGLLYLPTSTPSGDYWGGWRPGANLYAESLVCLDAATGQRKWHFQGVHHGLWDYDFGSAPTLATITVAGRRIDAVAQVSKQGFTYVFDRVTGEPVWPIEERPVDTTTDVPGEQVYPTQPFPTKPPPFFPQGISLDDANDLTPAIKGLAQEQLKQYRLGPLYTPPSLRGTLQRPSAMGGANWGGAAFDPQTGLLFVKVSDSYSVNRVCKNDRKNPDVDWEYSNYCGSTGMFAPPAADRSAQQAPEGGPAGTTAPRSGGNSLGAIPLNKPPYAYLVAIDLNKGEIAWKVPFGEGSQAIRQHPLLKGVALPDRLGTPGPPGPIVTSGGLLFVGGGDPYLYAFDKATGKELSRVATPFPTSANPMTYRTRSGRQFVVIATGSGPDATLAAFALRTGPATTTAKPAPAAPAASAPAQDANAAFTNVCVPCHGAAGRGGLAPALVPMTRGADEVLAIVREGNGSMAPISSREVSDEQVRQIVEYLRSLR